jgi:predicted kinase
VGKVNGRRGFLAVGGVGDSPEPLLILLHGGPATGKTTLGLRLAETLGIPYFSKDGIKEPMFEAIGLPVAWETDDGLSGRNMDEASLAILFYLIEALLLARTSGVIDSTFLARHTPRFRSLQERHSFRLVQILCRTEARALRRRWAGRAASGERHAGHRDQDLAQRLDPAAIDRVYRHLEIGGLQITLDTTTPTSAEEYEGVVGRIQGH